MTDKRYELNENTINVLLNYLATKPYKEVHVLINELYQAKPIEPEGGKK